MNILFRTSILYIVQKFMVFPGVGYFVAEIFWGGFVVVVVVLLFVCLEFFCFVLFYF